jgi:hypothetical protein
LYRADRVIRIKSVVFDAAVRAPGGSTSITWATESDYAMHYEPSSGLIRIATRGSVPVARYVHVSRATEMELDEATIPSAKSETPHKKT